MTDGYHESLKKTYPQLSANLKSNILKSKMFNVMAQGNDVYIKLNPNQVKTRNIFFLAFFFCLLESYYTDFLMGI